MAWTEVTLTPPTDAIGLSLSLLYSNLLTHRIGLLFVLFYLKMAKTPSIPL